MREEKILVGFKLNIGTIGVVLNFEFCHTSSPSGTHEHFACGGCGFNSPSGWWLIWSTVPSQSAVRKEVTKEHRNQWHTVEFWILPHNTPSGTFEHLAYGCGSNF